MRQMVIVVLGLVLAMAVPPSQAQADSIILGEPVTASVMGGTSYTYEVFVAGAELHAGDFFVLYDFVGYISGSLDSTLLLGFADDDTMTDGPTPFMQAYVDNLSI